MIYKTREHRWPKQPPIENVVLADHAYCWTPGDDVHKMPREDRIKERTAIVKAEKIVLDFECYPWLSKDIRYQSKAFVGNPADETRRVMDDIGIIVGWMREVKPDCRIGMFLTPAHGQGQAEIIKQIHGDESRETAWEVARWRAATAYYVYLADYLDFTCPCLYTKYTLGEDDWVAWAKVVLENARSFGKPVLPFLMPTIRNEDGKYVMMDSGFWQKQLQTCQALSDGPIIYTTDSLIWTVTEAEIRAGNKGA